MKKGDAVRDYWLIKSILSFVGWAYAIACAIALTLAWRIPTERRAKTTAVVFVLALISIFPIKAYREFQREQQASEDLKQRQTKAMALFQERCKTAGEKIYKTVDNVTGVYLINRRPKPERLPTNQYDPNDPAGDAARGEGYIETFFQGRLYDFLLSNNKRGAYVFVEAPAEDGRGVIRYTDRRDAAAMAGPMKLTEERTSERTSRYGIEWADISTKEDRDFWIAGSRIRVVDLQTREILAERVGYIVDEGQGNRAGAREPWLFALNTACPSFPLLHGQYAEAWGTTRYFVEKVIRPVETRRD